MGWGSLQMTDDLDEERKFSSASARFPTTLGTFDGRACCDGHAAASAAAVPLASVSLFFFGRSKDIAAIVAGSICIRKSLL